MKIAGAGAIAMSMAMAGAAEFYLQDCEGTFKNGTVMRHVMVTSNSASSKACGQTDHGNLTYTRGGPFNYEQGQNLIGCQLHRVADESSEEQGYAVCGDGKNITLYYTEARSVDEWECDNAKYKCKKGALTNNKDQATTPGGDKKGSKNDTSDSDDGAEASSTEEVGLGGAMSNIVSYNVLALGLLVAFASL
ncbi:hypothetical protein TRICI_005134 [Trichomonascus ciferrii]|uniref:Uncharacterized protein n=1 Tax=Trichomonascus ciferrii TaxID=44093 RepID=A0A642UVX5_9ASCO|nr:hypothetical protein TRICI_005134 [Trichomonascus ciferrii]